MDMQALLDLAKLYDDDLIAIVLTIPRVYAFMSSSQVFNSAAIPGLSRTGTLLSLLFVLAPINFAFAQAFPHEIGPLALLVAKEYALGVVLGYFVAWIFWVVQTAGTFIDNQRGASIASSIDPLLGAESSPLGDMFSLVFLTYLFATASVLQVLGLLFGSFKIWPVARVWPVLPATFPVLILTIFDSSMRLGFNIAAPVIAVMFLAEFALAMVSRFAPQIQVFVLAMPIKSMLAILMLVFYSYVLFPYVDRQVGSAVGFSRQFYGILDAGPAAAGARP